MSEKSKNTKKPKKEKIKYIDDGRTLSDMSGTSGGLFLPPKKRKKTVSPLDEKKPWQTYIEAVKMMFIPMLVVIGLIGFVFLLMYFAMK